MKTSDELAARLRLRILTDLHTGEIGAGDRLPSIRGLAAELERDHRVVASAYRTLEEEGLVEIRPRSGVFVAPRREPALDDVLPARARWIAEVLVQGLGRRVTAPELPKLLEQCTRSLELRCVCVESVEDVVETLCGEIEEGLGLSTKAVLVPDGRGLGNGTELEEAAAGADLVATTVFHAPAVREAVPELTVVEIRLGPEWIGRIRRALREGTVTVVVKDPAFEERLRAALDGEGELLRVLAAKELDGQLEDQDEEGALFVTPPARRLLGRVEHPALRENGLMLSHETLRELAKFVVRRNVEEGHCADRAAA